MISFLTRTYSVLLGVNTEYGIGECWGTGRICRLFWIFAEMPAKIRSLRSSAVVNACCVSITTGDCGAAGLESSFTALFTASFMPAVSTAFAVCIGIVRGSDSGCSNSDAFCEGIACNGSGSVICDFSLTTGAWSGRSTCAICVEGARRVLRLS
jgi:hypothetical protein